MRVLVTGGTGYLGRAIVSAAAARGHDVVVYARTASRSGLPGRLVDGDVRDGEALADAARGCEAICHTAALVAVWRPRVADFGDVNVGGLENVLRAATRQRIARIVYTSSFMALPPAGAAEPIAANPYQQTKTAADRVARRAIAGGAPLVVLYPGVVYGPGPLTAGNLVGRMVSDHLAGRLPGMVGADRVWSFAWIDEVAAGHVAAIERGAPGALYPLGGENAPQRRLWESVRALTGRTLPRAIPRWQAGLAAWAGEGLARVSGREPPLTRGALTVLDHDWPLDSGQAIADLGYRVVSLADGVARLIPLLDHAGT